MTLLDIITPTNPILRRKARKVTAFTPRLQVLIDDMIETMKAALGAGLAAPQVAEGLRLFVVYLEEDPATEDDPDVPPAPGVGRLHVMINPDIVRLSGEKVVGNEACLSIPGYAGEVERRDQIVIRYLDRHGQKRKLKTHGWLARVLQHECDHLDGILFIDRATKVWKVEEEEEQEQESTVVA